MVHLSSVSAKAGPPISPPTASGSSPSFNPNHPSSSSTPLARANRSSLNAATLKTTPARNGFVMARACSSGGNEHGKGTRFYVQDVTGGTPRPVTPEGTRDGRLSADGNLVLARGPEGKYSLYPLAGGDPRPVSGLTDTDIIAQWRPDGRSVLAYRRAEVPCRLDRVDLATGHRTLFEELAPTDRTGLLSMRELFVTDDLHSLAYTAYYQVSSLFVSEPNH
jgi:hypothetical protein